MNWKIESQHFQSTLSITCSFCRMWFLRVILVDARSDMAGSIDQEFLGLVGRLCAGRAFPTVFIETGTNFGYSARLAAQIWPHVFTIELSIGCLERSRPILPPNVVCCYGDSADVLPSLLSVIDCPVVAYLDAHWSGGIAAKGPDETPLLRELKALESHKHRDIIICDDFRLFGKTGVCGIAGDEQYPPMRFDWTAVTEDLCAAVLGSRIEHKEIISDRLVFVTKGY
jgi:hypothetical protein